MTIEFRNNNPNITERITTSDGSKLMGVGLYNDTLPSGTNSAKIGLTLDPIGKRRYVVEPTQLEVYVGHITLKGGGTTPPLLDIPNAQFELTGIEMFMKTAEGYEKGRIYPKK